MRKLQTLLEGQYCVNITDCYLGCPGLQVGDSTGGPGQAGKSYSKERRLSVYKKLVQSKEPDHLQGTFSLVTSHNFDQFLRKIGTGPLSLNMVMRASVLLTIVKVILCT